MRMNHFGYSNPRVDALCDRADAELDMNKRAPLYQQADLIAMDDVAVLPITYYSIPTLIKPYVHNVAFNLNGPMPHYTTRIQHQ